MWPFKFGANKTKSNHIVSLFWQNNVIYYSIGQKNDQNQLTIDSCDHLPFDENNIIPQIEALVNRFDLENANLRVILPANLYELFLIEALPVQEPEIQAALQWRLKELLSYPVSEALWDFYQVPTKDARQYYLYVVVAKKQFLVNLSQAAEKLNLQFSTITVPPLALNKILQYEADIDKGIALVYAENDHLQFMISKDNVLYLVRRFDCDLAKIQSSDAQEIEKLTLLIQRSLDYYQSQLHQSLPARLLTTLEVPNLLDLINQNLNIKMEILTSNSLISVQCPSALHGVEAYISLGGLLENKDSYASGNQPIPAHSQG